jgi:hypothetical protein
LHASVIVCLRDSLGFAILEHGHQLREAAGMLRSLGGKATDVGRPFSGGKLRLDPIVEFDADGARFVGQAQHPLGRVRESFAQGLRGRFLELRHGGAISIGAGL